MKANILPRGSMPTLTIQGQNIKTFNNSSIENVNYSNLLGKTLNNTIYSRAPNIKNAYSTSTINIGRSPNINKQNTITHIRQSNTTNKKNFDRFIDSNKISFENIRQYKINTYDFLNDDDFSSEENDDQKAFVDYVPSNDMIGILENQDIQDERLLELMQQKKNLKEIRRTP